MDNTMLRIAIRRNNVITLPSAKKSEGHISPTIIASLQNEVNQYGYALDADTLKHLTSFSKKQLKEIHENLCEALNFETNKDLVPFYPNFPEQVMSATDFELFINAQAHYLGSLFGMKLRLAEIDAKNSDSVDEVVPENPIYITLGFIAEEDYALSAALEIAHSKVSVSVNDFKDLSALINSLDEVDSFLKEWNTDVPNKENLMYVLLSLKNVTGDDFNEIFASRIKTTNDVLRYAITLATGNAVFQKTSTPRIALKRADRRLIMSKLNSFSEDKNLQDMKRYHSLWNRLSRVIHPEEYAETFPVALATFKRLAAKDFGRSYNSYVEEHLTYGNTRKASEILSAMPGEFARRLNELLTVALNKDERKHVLESFRNIVSDVPSNVLWQMYPMFQNRNIAEVRYITPKGGSSIGVALPMPEKAYSDKVVGKVKEIIIEGLLAQYGVKESLGNVWIDPELKNFTLPLGIRSASPSANAIARGSRVKLSEENIQRAYVWWQNKEQQKDDPSAMYGYNYGNEGQPIDVDLSAIAYDENFVKLSSVSYTHLRTANGSIIHSGDFTNAPRPFGAVEYIDFDKSKLLAEGVRYISVAIQVYSGDSFDGFDCLGGIMNVRQDESGKQFDARTVAKSFDIQAPVRNALPMVIDLETNEMVWVDGSMETHVKQTNSIANHGVVYASLAESTLNKNYANLYQLFTIHANARGTVVESADEADEVFSVENGVPNVALATVLSDFL